MDTQQRPAQPGELCTCGRQAVTVYSNERFGDVGHCGIDGAAFRPVLPCPWCGSSEPHKESYGDPARCPDYQLQAPQGWDGMAEETTGLRTPETTWEYALSAADMLTRWRAREVPALARDPLRTDVVVLLGTALYAWSRASMVEGSAVKEASLAYLHHLLQDQGAWISDCPPPPGMGREEKDAMLLDFGRMAIARYAAQDVLVAHLSAAADPAVTVEGRADALRD